MTVSPSCSLLHTQSLPPWVFSVRGSLRSWESPSAGKVRTGVSDYVKIALFFFLVLQIKTIFKLDKSKCFTKRFVLRLGINKNIEWKQSNLKHNPPTSPLLSVLREDESQMWSAVIPEGECPSLWHWDNPGLHRSNTAHLKKAMCGWPLHPFCFSVCSWGMLVVEITFNLLDLIISLKNKVR